MGMKEVSGTESVPVTEKATAMVTATAKTIPEPFHLYLKKTVAVINERRAL